VVSSIAHKNGKIDFDDIQTSQNYTLESAYAQSKLANLLFTHALAKRLKGTPITVNALHPGIVATNLGSNHNWLRTKARNVLKRSLLSPEEGARTVVFLATDEGVQNISGRYFFECKPIESSDASHDECVAERLWEMSESLAGMRHSENGRKAIPHSALVPISA